MKYTFTAAALVRIGEILDVWPCPDRGTMKALDAIAAKVELSDEDKLSWRSIGDQSARGSSYSMAASS